jgi:hypothetical protein
MGPTSAKKLQEGPRKSKIGFLPNHLRGFQRHYDAFTQQLGRKMQKVPSFVFLLFPLLLSISLFGTAPFGQSGCDYIMIRAGVTVI